jgi:hypothetical protein
VAQQVGRPWAARPIWPPAGHPQSGPMGPVSVLDQDPGDPCRPTTGHAQGCIAGPRSRRPDLRAGSVLARELPKRRSRSGGGATSGAVRVVSAPSGNGVARRPRPRRSPASHQVRSARRGARLEIAQPPRARLTALKRERGRTRLSAACRGGCCIKSPRERRCRLAEIGARAAEWREVASGRRHVTDDLAFFGAHPYNGSSELRWGRSYRCQVRGGVTPMGPAPQWMVVARRRCCWRTPARSARSVRYVSRAM